MANALTSTKRSKVRSDNTSTIPAKAVIQIAYLVSIMSLPRMVKLPLPAMEVE